MPFSDFDTCFHEHALSILNTLAFRPLMLLYLLYYRMYSCSRAENLFSNDAEGSDSSNNDDENLDSLDQENMVEACSCSLGEEEMVSYDGIDADDLFTVHVGIEEIDPVCIKIQIFFGEETHRKIEFSTNTLMMCWRSCTIPFIHMIKRL